MQSPGPPYQSTMGSAMNYSERPYENQMASHCQTNSYPSYQPPSPYRPHPVSPPAHAHQYGPHGGHQMHGSLAAAYGSSHQLGPYGSAPASHYASLGPDLYGGRPSMYSSPSARAMQQMKAAWGADNNSNSSTEIMQYSQPSPRPMMPPPSMHSPPHAGMGGATPGPPHYRQVPIVSAAAGHSPHSWSQSQIPSPGVLHSPRTTPSPLPAHTRSPVGGGQPFSPPPAAPSPQQPQQHHPPPSMTPHPPPPHKTTPSPPSGATTPAPTSGGARQPMCGSPSGSQGTGNSDPLQSLQKMVMLDSETVESPITRANYEMAANQGGGGAASAPGAGRPASYFSVEQLAGSDPGSPYPTYYNLDQNRLCTPPRTAMSTPTSSTFSSAPDSTSSNSPRSDSRTTTASADSSSHVNHVNGDVNPHIANAIATTGPTETPQPPQPGPPPPRRPEFENFGVADVRMTNGNHSAEPTGIREDLAGPVSSDSENKDTQDFLQHLGGGVPPLPEPDGTVDLRRKPPKAPRGRRRVFGHDLQCDPLMENSMDMPRNKSMMMGEERRNSTLPEFEITNGKPENCDDVYPTDGGYVPRPPRYYSPTNRWNKMGPLEDGFMGMQQSKPYPDECITLPKPKRGRKRKTYDQDGIVPEWDMYNSEMVHRPPRVSRGGTRGRRGSRRRGGIAAYPANNGEVPMDMYSNDPMMTMRNHPSNGMGEMAGPAPDKDVPWASHGYHMGPPPAAMNADYGSKDSMSVIKPPMMDSHAMDNSSLNSSIAQSQPPNYQSDVPSDDRTRGPLLFTVNKDGSTVKLQDSNQMNNSNSMQNQGQYYDPVLGQMMQQPIKKKRGRPFGSKNKPKPPGEERQPRRRRKKEVFFGPEGPPPPIIKKRIINGPYVHIMGIRNKPLVVSVVNPPPKDENAEAKYWQQKQQQLQFGGVIRQSIGAGPGLPHIYDTITKDRSWLCSLCCKNSHYRGLGDLFGPYYLNGDQKPSNLSAPPSPAPMSAFGNESSEAGDDLEPEDSREDPSSSCSEVPGGRRFPGKRKSDVMEQMFRAALLRKAKQANGQKPLEEMSNHMSSCDMPLSTPGQYPLDSPVDNKEFWVHEECAVWSKNVYLFGHRLRGLEETVLQSVDKLCSRCKFPGASLSCASENCPEFYHFLCARDNWCRMDDDTYTIYCPQHKTLSGHCEEHRSIQNS